MAKQSVIAVALAQVVEGRKGTNDHTPAQVLRYYRERFTDEDGNCPYTDSELLGLAAVEGMRRRMALAKDGARFAAGEAPSHVYLPRPTDGAVHAAKLQAATGEARGAFAAMLWGAKAAKAIEAPAPKAAPVKAPKAAPVKAPKAKAAKAKAPTPAQIKAREAFAAKAKARAAAKAKPTPKAAPVPAAPAKTAKGEARAARIAAKAAKVGASLPVSRPDLTPATITKPNPAPAVKAVTLANGQTFQIEDATGI
jgi:hypothetical protein